MVKFKPALERRYPIALAKVLRNAVPEPGSVVPNTQASRWFPTMT